MINYRLTFRARIKQEDGTIKLFYQGDQYLTSFLRRVGSFLYYHDPDADEKHEAYLEQTVDEVLDQCTGIKDKNGKYIFEGDIVTYDTEDGGWAFAIIKWSDDEEAGYNEDSGLLIAGFYLSVLGEYEQEEDDEDGGFQVIGNIWNNPELLKPKTE